MKATLFDFLDRSAKSNLKDNDINEYNRLKNELLSENEPIESIESVLNGFMWTCLETYNSENTE